MYRFHDPDGFLFLAALELLEEDGVLAGQIVGEGQVVVACSLFGLALALEGLLVALDIFGKQILAADLVEVAKVVDAFVRKEPDLVERFGDELLLAPVDVPIVLLGLPILPASQGLLDAVGEVGLELNLRTMSTSTY